MKTWQEEFDKFVDHDEYIGYIHRDTLAIEMKDFIEKIRKEAISDVIEDIPNTLPAHPKQHPCDNKPIKDQLRDKWL